jgi:GLPGLI family protein
MNLFTTFLLLTVYFCCAQSKSGIVEYTIESLSPENTINIAKASKDISEQKALLEMFSNEKAHFILEFNNHEALYKSAKIAMQSDANKSQKPKFLEVFGGGSSLYYTNSTEKLLITQKNSLGQLFLISASFKEWELTTETKKIGDYTCYKAKYISKNGNKNLINEVWYTPEIPFQFGPTTYVGLPGLVLEVIAGKIRFTATKIQLSSESTTITKPEKGNKVSEEEYMKIVEKAADELGF